MLFHFLLFISILTYFGVKNQPTQRIIIFGENTFPIEYIGNYNPIDPETKISNFKLVLATTSLPTKSTLHFWFNPIKYKLLGQTALRSRILANKKSKDKFIKKNEKNEADVRVVVCKKKLKPKDESKCEIKSIKAKKKTSESEVPGKKEIELNLGDGNFGFIDSKEIDLKKNDILYWDSGYEPLENSWKEEVLLGAFEPIEYSPISTPTTPALTPKNSKNINNQDFIYYLYSNSNLKKEPFDAFYKKIVDKNTFIITQITSKNTLKKDIVSFGMSYGYNFVGFAFDKISFEVPLEGLNEDKWFFVTVSLDYSIPKANIVIVSGLEITQATINLETKYTFSSSVMTVGGFSEKIQDSIDNHCDCNFNNFNWIIGSYVEDIQTIMDLRRSLLKPLFLSNFRKPEFDASRQIISGRVTKNYFTNELVESKAAYIQLGTTNKVENTDAIVDPLMLSLLFDGSKQALFDPGFLLFQNNRFEITVSFWFKHNGIVPTKSMQTLFRNENDNQNNFLSIEFNQILDPKSKLLMQSIQVYAYNKYTSILNFYGGTWNFLLLRVMTTPGNVGILVNVDIINEKAKYSSSDFINPPDMTYQGFILKLKSIQKFMIAPNFQGYIKMFRFYQGSVINGIDEVPRISQDCLIWHGIGDYLISNATLSKNLILEKDCFICKENFIKLDLICTSKETICPDGNLDFRSTLRACEECPSCTPPECGNGKREVGEVCDDGEKNKELSKCTANCDGVKSGYKCKDVWVNKLDVKDECEADCGDGKIFPPEECDRGEINDVGCVQCKLTPGYFCTINSCVKCSESCIRCIDATHCSSCDPSKYLSIDGKCIDTCPPDSFYDSSRKCHQCSSAMSNCYSCRSASICFKCLDGYYLNTNLTGTFCVQKCPATTFESSTDGTCGRCPTNCEKCTEAYSCKLCSEGYASTPGNMCTNSCGFGFYMNRNTKKCEKCLEKCKTCPDSITCNECEALNYLSSEKNICSSKCIDGEVSKDGKACIKCREAFTSLNCLTCDLKGCLSCVNSNEFLKDDRSCGQCPIAFYGKSLTKKCEACPPLCNKCSETTGSSQTICGSCINGKFLNEVTQSCVDQCKNGYYNDEFSLKCTACKVSNCDNCASDPNKCSICFPKFQYYNPYLNLCIASISEGYFAKSDNTLEKCKQNCLVCSSTTDCFKCSSNTAIHLTNCVDSCPSGYTNILGKCETCQISYCENCDDNINQCKKCSSGYFFNTKTSKCMANCGVTPFYYDLDLRKCESCTIPNCACCKNNPNICTVCMQGYRLSKSLCIRTPCPARFGIKSSTNNLVQCNNLEQKSLTYEECISCEDQKCLFCELNFQVCKECIQTPPSPPLYVLSDACTSMVPDNYYIATDGITLLKCPNRCSKCKSGSGECTACFDKTLKIENGQCTTVCSTDLLNTAKQLYCGSVCSSFTTATDVACQSCQNNIHEKCLTCRSPFYLLNDLKTCQAKCDWPGFYIKKETINEIQYCLPCDNSCKTCDDKGCTFCNTAGYKLIKMPDNSLITCNPSCIMGTYEDTETNKCIPCEVLNCEKCETGSKNCSRCKSNFYLFINKENTPSCETYCPKGYYKNIKMCTECSTENCENCDPPTCTGCQPTPTCNKCLNGLVLQMNTQKCQNNCDFGYYQKDLICIECLNRCKTCKVENSIKSCESCYQDFYLFEDGSGALICEILHTGYYVDETSNRQEKCMVFCNKCTKKDDCIEPNSNYLYDETTKTMIEKCKIGTYQDFPNALCKSCQLKISNCKECIKKDNIVNCIKCENSLVVNSNVCEADCPLLYSELNGICQKCPNNVGKCLQTIDSNNVIKITALECVLGFFLNPDNTCKNSCPENYYMNENNNKCDFCLPNCKKCKDSLICIECIFSHYLSSDEKSCVNDCLILINEFPLENKKCSKCIIENCDKCYSLTQCEKCKKTYLPIKESEIITNCALQLPSGYYLDVQDNIYKKCLITNCKTCDKTYCTLCNDEFVLSLSKLKCVLFCDLGQFKNNDNQCSKCSENCDKCSSLESCNQCQNKYYLHQKKCYSKCYENYFPDQETGICVECSKGCINCVNVQKCNKCDQNNSFYLDSSKENCVKKDEIPMNFFADEESGTIQQCLIDYCDKCKSKTECQSCLQNRFWDSVERKCVYSCTKSYGKNSTSGKCENCNDTFCEECDFDLSKCNKCIPNIILNLESKKCGTKCEEGYYLLNPETCAKCGLGCLKCDKIGLCELCESGYIKYKGICLNEKMPSNCSNCLKENLPCPLKTYKSNIECFDCKRPCINCTNTNCFNCEPNYFLSENKCNKICPKGKGLFLDPIKNECFSCDNYCLDCESLNKCANCTAGFELNTEGKCTLKDGFYIKKNDFKVLPCSENCSHCQNNTYCDKCDSNFTLINNSCYLNCSKSKYMDILGQCNVCKENCLNCTNNENCFECETNFILRDNNCISPKCIPHCSKCISSKCLECDANYILFENECRKCDSIKGFKKDCNEICGDGFLYDSIRSGHECDDGNNINGDGCDKDCKIENNFKCNRTNYTTPDLCFEKNPFNLTFYTTNEEDKAFIKPERRIKFVDNESLAKKIDIKIKEIDNSIYNYTVSYDNKTNIIVIKFSFIRSVQNLNMIFQLKANRLLLESSNSEKIDLLEDINGIPVDSKYYLEPSIVELNNYIVYSEKQKGQIQAIISAATPSTIGFMVSTGPLYLFNAFSFFWLMVDCIQVANFFLYINTDYPKNLVEFLKILSAANFNFLPNPFDSLTSTDQTKKNNLINQVAPYRFDSLNLTSSFLINSGSQLLMILIPLILYLLVILLDKYNIKTKKEGKISIYTKKIREGLEFGGLLRFYLMVFLQLTLGCFLQIQNMSVVGSFNIISGILGVFICLCICSVFIILFKVVSKIHKTEDEEFKKKFEVLYEDYQTNNFIQLNYPIISLLKKFFMVLILVLFHDIPYIELSALIILYSIGVFITLIGKPFKRRLTNAIIILTETGFVAVFCILIYLRTLDIDENQYLIPNETVEKRILIGWIVIIIISVVLFLYFIVYLRQQALAIRDLIIYIEDFKIKYNEYLKSLFRRKGKKSQYSNNSINLSSLSTVIIEKTDDVDKKYLDLDNAPETSFSKFFKDMKSRKTNTDSSIKRISENIGTNYSGDVDDLNKKKEIVRLTVRKIKEVRTDNTEEN